MSDAKTMVMWGQRKLELDKCGISGYDLSMHGVWNFVCRKKYCVDIFVR